MKNNNDNWFYTGLTEEYSYQTVLDRNIINASDDDLKLLKIIKKHSLNDFFEVLPFNDKRLILQNIIICFTLNFKIENEKKLKEKCINNLTEIELFINKHKFNPDKTKRTIFNNVTNKYKKYKSNKLSKNTNEYKDFRKFEEILELENIKNIKTSLIFLLSNKLIQKNCEMNIIN